MSPEELGFKVVVSDPKTGKAIQIEVKGEQKKTFLGKKIGDVVPGDLIGLKGYVLEITGGSDYAGFPMVKHVEGTGRKYIWWWKDKETRIKKMVHGNTISENIVQINTIIKEYGEKPFEELYKEFKSKKK